LGTVVKVSMLLSILDIKSAMHGLDMHVMTMCKCSVGDVSR
jgi:hypothetical protein